MYDRTYAHLQVIYTLTWKKNNNNYLRIIDQHECNQAEMLGDHQLLGDRNCALDFSFLSAVLV